MNVVHSCLFLFFIKEGQMFLMHLSEFLNIIIKKIYIYKYNCPYSCPKNEEFIKFFSCINWFNFFLFQVKNKILKELDFSFEKEEWSHVA